MVERVSRRGSARGNAHSRQPDPARQTTIPALLIAPRRSTPRRARCARRQNFTRSPLTNATWRFVDEALPMFEIAAILR
ncbi:hypothetical protein BCO18442_02326 [Burkholderia contaminans]|nr:hypothetical protein BCO19218_01126 [Burkholderia contaminans]VWC97613.1 hypothetical protein BCO18442_02326 [Burkholderia contaminans]